jgi:hypothetical protein
MRRTAQRAWASPRPSGQPRICVRTPSGRNAFPCRHVPLMSFLPAAVPETPDIAQARRFDDRCSGPATMSDGRGTSYTIFPEMSRTIFDAGLASGTSTTVLGKNPSWHCGRMRLGADKGPDMPAVQASGADGKECAERGVERPPSPTDRAKRPRRPSRAARRRPIGGEDREAQGIRMCICSRSKSMPWNARDGKPCRNPNPMEWSKRPRGPFGAAEDRSGETTGSLSAPQRRSPPIDVDAMERARREAVAGPRVPWNGRRRRAAGLRIQWNGRNRSGDRPGPPKTGRGDDLEAQGSRKCICSRSMSMSWSIRDAKPRRTRIPWNERKGPGDRPGSQRVGRRDGVARGTRKGVCSRSMSMPWSVRDGKPCRNPSPMERTKSLGFRIPSPMEHAKVEPGFTPERSAVSSKNRGYMGTHCASEFGSKEGIAPGYCLNDPFSEVTPRRCRPCRGPEAEKREGMVMGSSGSPGNPLLVRPVRLLPEAGPAMSAAGMERMRRRRWGTAREGKAGYPGAKACVSDRCRCHGACEMPGRA